jgi:hypothetical protein
MQNGKTAPQRGSFCAGLNNEKLLLLLLLPPKKNTATVLIKIKSW